MLKWILINKGKHVHIITYEPLNTIQHQVCTNCDSSLFTITSPLKLAKILILFEYSIIVNFGFVKLCIFNWFAHIFNRYVMHVVDIEQKYIFSNE
jgi:hypothetical protein